MKPNPQSNAANADPRAVGDLRRFWMPAGMGVVIVVLCLLAGCSSTKGTRASSVGAESLSATASPAGGPFIATSRTKGRFSLLARAQGTLRVAGGCVVLATSPSTDVLMIWPRGSRYQSTEGGGGVLGKDGELLGVVDGRTSQVFGGGYISDSGPRLIHDVLGGPVPAQCDVSGVFLTSGPVPT